MYLNMCLINLYHLENSFIDLLLRVLEWDGYANISKDDFTKRRRNNNNHATSNNNNRGFQILNPSCICQVLYIYFLFLICLQNELFYL